jgi:hypothetical protein
LATACAPSSSATGSATRQRQPVDAWHAPPMPRGDSPDHDVGPTRRLPADHHHQTPWSSRGQLGRVMVAASARNHANVAHAGRRDEWPPTGYSWRRASPPPPRWPPVERPAPGRFLVLDDDGDREAGQGEPRAHRQGSAGEAAQRPSTQ